MLELMGFLLLESDIVLDSRKKSGLILSTRGPDLASVTGDPLPIAAFPFHQLYQGRVLPHAGEGPPFEGHNLLGVEFLSHDAPAGVYVAQVRQWSEHKIAPILLESGRKGDSGERASAYVEKHKRPTPAADLWHDSRLF